MIDYNVIRRPRFTEKTTLQNEEHNQVVFEVAKNANKKQIKSTIEKVFDVKVLDVKTAKIKSKKKRRGQFVGSTSERKKAIIKLSEDSKIEYFESSRY